jgi:cyclopropane fatty-acyl-phospholipid synthase-like methyltransferase
MDRRQIVESGYDRMAEQYLASKDVHDRALLDALETLLPRLGPGCAALDLGCGAGVPATRWLAERCAVMGIDLSARQLALARANIPDAILLQASMTDVDFPAESFEAVVALHSIIHVPREAQPALVRGIHRWLKAAGTFLATWPLAAWEGTESDWMGWGSPMWWSHFDVETNLAMVESAGFVVERAEERVSGQETWLWVVARKHAQREPQ